MAESQFFFAKSSPSDKSRRIFKRVGGGELRNVALNPDIILLFSPMLHNKFNYQNFKLFYNSCIVGRSRMQFKEIVEHLKRRKCVDQVAFSFVNRDARQSNGRKPVGLACVKRPRKISFAALLPPGLNLIPVALRNPTKAFHTRLDLVHRV